MNSRLRLALLSSIITAALVYVVVEWRPLESEPTPAQPTGGDVAFSEPPQLTFAAGESVASGEQSGVQELSADEQNNIDVYRRYSRGVVNITAQTVTYTPDFFNTFLQAVPAEGSGSGVVVDIEGHIVTNYHVVENARSLEVTLWNQSRYPATVVGTDPTNDLAVIQIDAEGVDWVPIPFGTTEGLQVGQKVLAIGNPFGLERTLTTGIISSLARSIEADDIVIEGVIQTDAAINSGNSGGPLLNARGEVIGINTAIISGATGIGFAIPVETVSRVTHDLIAYGRVRRVHLGVSRGGDISQLGPYAEYLDLGADSGVLVEEVIPDSPADRAGIRGASARQRVGRYVFAVGGDVIVAIDGRDVASMTQIRTILEPMQPGDEIQVTIVREGERRNLDVTLQERSG